jgi:hypothetical protein
MEELGIGGRFVDAIQWQPPIEEAMRASQIRGPLA